MHLQRGGGGGRVGADCAALARADTSIAEREAQRDRTALLAAQGADANHSTERIVEIRKNISSG